MGRGKSTLVVLAGLLLAFAAGAVASADGARALTSTADGAWFWRSPQPLGGVYSEICFAGDAVVAVGEAGAIARSEDFGATWVAAASGTTAPLLDVTFIDAQNGWAVGGDEEEYGPDRSVLAGRTAARSALHSAAAARMLPIPIYVDENERVVLHTADGGRTWQRQMAPGQYELNAVTFVDPQNGWAVGHAGTILHTADGGASWLSQESGHDDELVSVTFSDRRHGMVGGPGGRLLRTADGGRTWRPSPLLGYGPRVCLDEMVFADARRGWAIVNDTYFWAPCKLAKTTDGGLHWRTILSMPDTWIEHLTRSDDGRLWLTAGYSGATGGSSLTFMDSADGGRSWNRHRANIAWGDIVARGDRVLCVGWGAAVSSDRGAHWTPLTSWSYVPRQLDMVDAAHGWGLTGEFGDEGRTLVHTRDGATWYEQPVTVPAGVYALDFADDASGWLVGIETGSTVERSRALLLHTADGGRTWQKQGRDIVGGLYSVFALDAAHAWATGMMDSGSETPGVLCGTADGGQTWVTQQLPGTFVPTDVRFVDQDRGWACGAEMVGDEGVIAIVHTEDGGAHWTAQNTSTVLPRGGLLSSVCFADANHGLVLGLSEGPRSLLLATDDGGQTWRRLGAGQPFEDHVLLKVMMVNEREGWLLGDSVWRTDDGGRSWTQCASLGAFLDGSVAGGAGFIANGLDFLSSTDLAGDTAPPNSCNDFDGRWHRRPAAVNLATADIGGGSVIAFDYRIDDDPVWHPVTGPVRFAAPSDHSGDGCHLLHYRAVDSNGNVEPVCRLTVPIDTFGPRTKVLGAVRTRRLHRTTLYYRVGDATSTDASVVVVVRRSGSAKVMRRWRAYPETNKRVSITFRCTLPAGRYALTVLATDLAGNRQEKAGHGMLIVRK